MSNQAGAAEPASRIADGRTPVADRIRDRIRKARGRFRANDNIAAHMKAGELEALKAEVQARMRDVLAALVIDTDSDHNTNDTAKRVAKMFIDEVFAGRYRAAPSVTEFPNASRLNELMIVGPVTVRSACSHHFCPILGRIWVGVMPNAARLSELMIVGPIKVRSACSHHLCPILGKVWIGIMPNEFSNLIGLSKYARICDWIMSRPQIQEEAVIMLADELQTRVRPDGLAIVMEADHFCMHWRGVKDDESMMTNSVMRGAFLKDANLRREFLSLLSKKNGG